MRRYKEKGDEDIGSSSPFSHIQKVKGSLFGFGRKSRAMPLVPASFKGIHIFKTLVFHLLRHPGGGSFARSGAIQNISLIRVICGNPILKIGRVSVNRTADFYVTSPPVTSRPDIQKNHIGIVQHFLCFLLGYTRNFRCRHGRRGDDQSRHHECGQNHQSF